ncbi:MAG: hypothetical protein C5B54_11215 [Acidobacteria bacterium]|nr:MAG: hypothetical protein C5B54_11215 [Acidobacteriota bacterium]
MRQIAFSVFSIVLVFMLSGFVRAEESDSPLEKSLYRLGLSRGASAVYKKEHGFAYAGTGEMLVEKFSDTNNIGQPSGKDLELGLVRGVAFLGYRFSERMLVNTEFRWDRDLIDKPAGQFNVDSAYLEYQWSDSFALRGGMILVPSGLTNEFFTVDEFMGTRKPTGETYVIPVPWHALGFGAAGHWRFIDYRAFVVNGLNAAGFTIDGSRGGRETSSDTLSHPAIVLRFDIHVLPGGMFGASYYDGHSVVAGDKPANFNVPTQVEEIHWQFNRGGVWIRAQYSKVGLDNEPELNAYLGTTGINGVGSRMVGGSLEGGFDFWAHRQNGTRLMPYMRGEVVNPQDALPQGAIDLGLLKNLIVDVTTYTYGIEYRPIAPLILKADYQRNHSEHVDYGVNQFNIAAAYIF